MLKLNFNTFENEMINCNTWAVIGFCFSFVLLIYILVILQYVLYYGVIHLWIIVEEMCTKYGIYYPFYSCY